MDDDDLRPKDVHQADQILALLASDPGWVLTTSRIHTATAPDGWQPRTACILLRLERTGQVEAIRYPDCYTLWRIADGASTLTAAMLPPLDVIDQKGRNRG